jgi:hypothetical protein
VPEFLALTTCLILLVLIGCLRGCDGVGERAKDHLGTAIQVVSTAMGVFGALYFASCQSERVTLQQLDNMIEASLFEARESLSMVREVTSVTRQTKNSDRLVLESPARTLSLLVEYPPFVERVDPRTASELVLLSTKLRWKLDLLPVNNGETVWGAGYVPISADPREVEQNLERAIALLEKPLLRR